jgi:hypothetical protein
MKLFQSTGTILDEIEGEFREDGMFAVSHWPEARVSGDGRFLQRLVESLESDTNDNKAA